MINQCKKGIKGCTFISHMKNAVIKFFCDLSVRSDSSWKSSVGIPERGVKLEASARYAWPCASADNG